MSATNEHLSVQPSVAPVVENWWSDPSAQLYGTPVSTIASPEDVIRTDVNGDRITETLQRIREVDTDGSAIVPLAEDYRATPTGQAERELTFTEIASKAKGHKLHLSFDAADGAKMDRVTVLLDTLAQNGGITAFKVGQNSEQEGKDATIYVGHKDKTLLIADLLGKELSDVLDEPSGDVLDSDVPYAPKIMGRFEVQGLDPDFHQYGAAGFPLLNDDVGQYSMMRLQGASDEALTSFLAEAKVRAEEVLQSRYGTFYTGTATE